MKISNKLTLFLLLSIFSLNQQDRCGSVLAALIKFTNLKCTSLDAAYSKFRYCYLKAIKRDVIALNAHIELYQLPVTNVTMNVSLYKKTNSYHPFLYNITVDFCAFMKRRNNPVVKTLTTIFSAFSNMNHSCPYNHDIIFKNMILREDQFNMMPIPSGDYLAHLRMATLRQWKSEVKAYVTVGEGFNG